MQGNGDKQERQYRFSDNYRQSYFRWPDTDKSDHENVLLVVWRTVEAEMDTALRVLL